MPKPSPPSATHDPSIPAWPRYLAICGIIFPTALSVLNPSWSFPSFSPRQIIDSHDVFPFLVAPWAGPKSMFSLLSRIIQVALIWRAPSFGLGELLYGYWFWIQVVVYRTVVGFLLTRSVGWAFPALFSHYAMYETSSGYGPLLVVYLFTLDGAEITRLSGLRTDRTQPHSLVLGLSFLLCWLDMEPWTYGLTMIALIDIYQFTSFISRFCSRRQDKLATNTFPRRTFPLKTAYILVFLIVLTNAVSSWVSPTKHVLMPSSPLPPARLLDIIILSFPRPDVKASSKLITVTLESYAPLLSPNVSLAVFTHAEQHPAFDTVRDTFRQLQDITFYRDVDTHPDARSGQYLHLAEAFRWQLGRGAEQAEWMMIVEDDFPLCGKTDGTGRNALKTVMQMLEDGREGKGAIPARRGAFIGTGGSGLIFHRSLLPIMSHILRTHAELVSKLPPNMPNRPADVVMQDCLLGRDPLCPPRRPGGLIITSRLVMDHIGGMYSTNVNKALNSDKWRCGWRHAFHGMEEVEVVVVDDLW